MRNCIAEDNHGCGYAFYLPNLTGKSAPISLRLENCIARGSNRAAFSFTTEQRRSRRPGHRPGRVRRLHLCRRRGARRSRSERNRPPAAGSDSSTAASSIRPRTTPKTPAIVYQTRAGNTEDVGGVEFRDCILEDTIKRPIMEYGDWARGLRLVDVTGTMKIRRNGSETVHAFTPQLLDGLCPENVFKRFPKYDTRGVRFEPVAADPASESVTLRPFTLAPHRHARHPRPCGRRRRLRAWPPPRGQVRRPAGAGSRPLAPSGKKLALGEVPFLGEETLRFQAAETGLYRVRFDVGANKLKITACNRPACVSGEDRSHLVHRHHGRLLLPRAAPVQKSSA